MENKKSGLGFDALRAFIEKAVKLGKYPANTASGYIAALKTVERAFLSEEPKTIEYLLSHLEELFVRQNDLQLSHQSVPVYIGRIKKVCSDFNTYGTDATAIYRWNRTIRKRTSKVPETKEVKQNSNENNNTVENSENSFSQNPQVSDGVKLNVVSWRLRPGVVIRIELPEDLNENDVKKIKALLNIELGIDL
ncbi:MAG: hypothetical protein U0V75_06795 [Ferruginibacter sp.]